MKKICMISTVSITMRSFILEIAKRLHQEYGYDVTLICSPDDTFASNLPEYLHYIPVPMARGISLSGFKSIKMLREIFLQHKFDLIQYATPNASCYASIAGRQAHIPIRLYCQWGIRYVGFSGISRMLFKVIEKYTCKNSTHIRAVSHLNMEFAIRERLYSKEKVCVVGNGGTIGVDTTEYQLKQKLEWREEVRQKYGILPQEFLFGFSGRISVDKGSRELLGAFKRVAETNKDVKLILIGDNESQPGPLADIICWAKESPQVVITGKIDNREMKKYYSALDVLVHPTYREGFGMVIQEAGAMAVPVITTEIPGASEVMEAGVSCLLVPPKNEEALLEAMERLYRNPDLMNKLGAAAYDRTMTLYERQVMLRYQMMDYQKLLMQKSGGA